MLQNAVIGGLMIVWIVWVVASVLFGLTLWPRIADHMARINGLDKDSK